jgi:hypothetical protein
MRLPPARSKCRSRLRLALVDADPEKSDLFHLGVGGKGVGGPQHQFLGLKLLGGLDHGEQGVVGPHDQRLHLFAQFLRAIHDGGHQFAVVLIESRPAEGSVAAGDHLGRHHGDRGGVGVGFRQGFLEHVQVVGGADGDQFPIGPLQIQSFGSDFLGGALVKLFQVAVGDAAPSPFVVPFGSGEDD